jgi:hypothetical protein
MYFYQSAVDRGLLTVDQLTMPELKFRQSPQKVIFWTNFK